MAWVPVSYLRLSGAYIFILQEGFEIPAEAEGGVVDDQETF